MLTDQQLSTLKNELLNQKKQLDITEEETSIQENNIRDTTGELSLYDNHPADLGTELFEREKDLALSNHSESQLEKVKNALEAVEEGFTGFVKYVRRKYPLNVLKLYPTLLAA